MLHTGINIPPAAPAVLIVDHDRKLYDVLMKRSSELGIQAMHAPSLQDGLRKIRDDRYDVILARDILPDGAACYVVTEFLTESPAPEIIIYTTSGDPDQAEYALKCGVWDYVIDPAPEECLPDLLKRALRYRLYRFKRLQGSIHSLALGAAIGAAIGSTPTIPLHSVLILAATLLCRSNPIAGILAGFGRQS